ncbi:hypothetical protein B0H14DRAFT_3004060 [Mycena olivaceomarginata]|nr:hypothetical protein B0H14DRAFT_3004060 [Mycena olivaceomarginata]
MILEREREDMGKGILDELTLFALADPRFLAKHPDPAQAARRAPGNLPSLAVSAPSYAELSNETNSPISPRWCRILRCARAAPAVARDATVDTVILGHPIPKGTQVLMPVGMVQQAVRSATSKRAGGDGDTGRRGRAEVQPRAVAARRRIVRCANAGPWLAFGYGFRACFGQKLALLELRTFLAMVQFNFFFAALPEEINTWKSVETCFTRPIPWENM